MLKNQIKEKTKTVHSINGQLEISGTFNSAVTLDSRYATVSSAMANENSSQTTTTATTKVNMLLAKTPGRIHGLPVQSTERELPELVLCVIFIAGMSLSQPEYLNY
jgi:hypothetical protein